MRGAEVKGRGGEGEVFRWSWKESAKELKRRQVGTRVFIQERNSRYAVWLFRSDPVTVDVSGSSRADPRRGYTHSMVNGTMIQSCLL